MGMVYLLFCAIGKCLEILCIMLDVNFWIINSLIRLLTSVVSWLTSIPTLLSSSAAECWNRTLVCMLAAAEGLMSTAQGSLHVLGSWLQTLSDVPESFKMAGHLSSHVLLRTKDLLHRGLLSGHSALRQACEGCSIAFSLALYFVNTVVNMLLIGTQNCFSAVASMWEVVSCPLQKALELTLTVLTFLYSSLVAISVLLWTPCQFALEFLGSLGHIFVTIFVLNLYGLLLTVAVVVAITAIYLNPQLPQRGVHGALHYITTIPALHRLQRVLYRLYLLALERTQTAIEMGAWQRVAWQGSHTGQEGGRGAAEGDQGGGNRDGWQLEGNLEQRLVGDPGAHTQLATEHTGQEQSDGGLPQQSSAANQLRPDIPDPAFLCSSADRPLQKLHPAGERYRSPPTNSLLMLLKEHEERKKCVICQDRLKTVLLLPCRHLCLCRDCTDILKQQPPHQHSCPLCRQAIAHTMDVYL